MVTYYSEKTIELRGLSTDTKPMENIGNGSFFFEMDTGKAFVFNKEGNEWLEVPVTKILLLMRIIRIIRRRGL